MFKIERILTVIILLLYSLYEVNTLNSTPYRSIVISAEYKREYKFVINNTVEYILLYPVYNETWMETARIEVESNASHTTPLIVIARQKRGILSWQVPLILDNTYFNALVFNKTSRTLCSTKYYRTEYEHEYDEQEEFVSVTLNTGSHIDISFNLNVTKDSHFILGHREKRSVQISPSEPIFYGYIFSEQVESYVIVHVESDSDICMTVSIQNISCPVFDLERDIQFSDRWQTVSRQGGITVPKEAYPLGFFVVFVVKGDDTDCYGTPNIIPLRNKNVTVTIISSIAKKDYVTASVTVISIAFGFCVMYIIGIVVSKIKESKKINEDLLNDRECDNEDEPIPSPSTIEEVGIHQSVSIDEDSSLDEDDIDVMEDAFSDKEVIRTKLVLSVCDLARKDPKVLKKKSLLYLYYLATVSVFYTLPVVQLVLTYQREVRVTGNQDMCYYNFLCSHPLGALSDFNHVFSNFGYVVLGLLFIFLTYSREQDELKKDNNKCYGIPQHYGLFYAMGTALIMEGVLSGSYHVCPNRSNFQFDTSFMYMISVLCMIKIYQTRHPDINARAPITFGVLALIILIGLIGVLNGSTGFWIIFTIAHLLTCLFLTIQIYYMGRWKFGNFFTKLVQTCKHDARSGIKHLFRPLYVGRFIMLVIANLCNVAIAVVGNIRHEKNFATFLLVTLMSNLILYTLFYIIMKICNKERILPQPIIYIILSIVFWAAALYFFIHKTMSWALTPAQSRLYNRPCEFLHFFDSHDIWHFLSAFAMFFSFMALLTLDDDLIDVHRSQIPVF